MKIQFAKLLTTTGRMLVARLVKTNIFGQWHWTSYTVQTALATRLLLRNLVLLNQALAKNLRAKQAKNNSKILQIIFQKKHLLVSRCFFIFFYLLKSSIFHLKNLKSASLSGFNIKLYTIMIVHNFLPFFLPSDNQFFHSRVKEYF